MLAVEAAQALADCTTYKGAASVNVTISATLGDARSCFGTSHWYDFYTFTATRGQSLRVNFNSRAFSPFGAIQSYSDGTVLAFNYAASPGTVLFDYLVPSSGVYVLTASSFDTFGSGLYQITASEIFSSGGCSPSTTALCLNGNRFKVQVTWANAAQLTSGPGMAVSMTSDTGYFWFFSSNNVELTIKVVDGRPVNGKYWVFYGAMSDVSYTVTITDTATGVVRTYTNRQGTLASVADTSAF